jgi:hypothetical protein
MSAVARLLPRYWDGSRLLRFLTGLAMLTLAFTAHLQPAVQPAPDPVTPPAAVAEVAPAVSPVVTVAAEPAPAVRPARPISPPATPAVLAFAVLSLFVTTGLRVRAERAPPMA